MRSIRPFIYNHLKTLLKSYDQSVEERLSKNLKRVPFDAYLRMYYKDNKTLGPNERSVITEASYKFMRHQILLGYLAKSEDTTKKLDALTDWDAFTQALTNPRIPSYVRCSCPRELFDMISSQYGEHNAYEYIQDSNTKAPLTIRVNPLKTFRKKFIQEWKKKDEAFMFKKTEFSPYGLIFTGPKQINLQETQQFREGQFEIQDEASQLCALRVLCKPKDKVLDFCAGSGGKTLAFIHQMEKSKGVVVLHDVREEVLEKARKRCARAGATNLMFMTDRRDLKNMKFDWIVLDVPCTGLGTLRRNPDLKHYFKKENLDQLVETQRQIFDNAIRYLKPDGKLVYITCSFLKEENQQQIKHFMNLYNMKTHGEGYFQSLPKKDSMDAFFSATLEFN